jgi:hypothetical protein
MRITRDVIRDLIPLYQAGEASSDTKALVEEFLKQDPEFGREVSERTRMPFEALPVELPAEHEIKTLERTKKMIRLRSWLMALAIFFTLLPFSMGVDTEKIRWSLWRDAPVLAGFSLVAAIGFWIAFYFMRRRLRATSL